MQWQAAALAAGEIAQGWTREGGPGGAILLFDADDIRAEACGGLASLELDLPFRADTAVRFASISKHFLCGLLATDGHIGFDDALGAHLPLPPALGAVTVGRALDMTGGLPDAMETLWLLGVPPTATLDRHALLRFVSSLEATNFAPGTEISYSNTGYRLVQAALEAKGIDYAAALHERFFRPLGLSIRFPEDETDIVPALATGYWHGPRGWQRGRYGLHFSASGGLAGSALDLTAWAQALMSRRGPADGLLARLGARRHLADGRATEYGLGLARSPVPGLIALGHGGSLPGYKNHFLFAPEYKAGVVVLSNREDTDAHGVALRVMAALAGTTLTEPTPALPDGRFLAEDGPFWLEHQGGTATFLGAQETLYPGEGGFAEGRSAHLPMRLRLAGGVIEGEIGHVARRFHPVPDGLSASGAWAGHWVCAAQNARFDIAVSAGVARLAIGAGPLYMELELTPLGPDMALMERGGDGPWRQRTCLQFSGNTVRLVTNRSRILVFERG
ncbi:serine hydrolase domain-containing protein [Limobrevibacterium gyesilva]|uniref:Serine hydrolase n=1 Tax=Limobrevibacterium gyesilva TaxID=2991712 RepID=A0AA42CG36_9PROT|nr:serine hydrolase [Limobrevibacterium gyesilva]MCW3473435.1 serine hydrolase [Limobrevibacterium gyesilva]